MNYSSIGRSGTLAKLVFATGAKVASALAAFALTVTVTRNLPKEQAGLFLLGFTILAVLSVFFRLGLDNVILRFLSAHGTSNFAQEKLNRGLVWIATVTIPITVAGMIFSEHIATNMFNKPDFGVVLFWMMPALPSMAIFFLLAMAFQSQHRVVTTTFFQNLGISTFFLMGFAVLCVLLPGTIDAKMASQIYSVSALIILVMALLAWFSQVGIRFDFEVYDDPELRSASSNLWVSVCMSLLVQWSGILIAGAVLSAEEVAYLSAAQRTAMLISFVLMVVNLVVAPRYALMWVKKDLEGIRRLAKQSTRGMILFASPLLACMLLIPEKIMSVFGNGFEEAGVCLIILILGQFVNVVSGSVAYILNMSGHEADYRKATLASGAVAIVLALILTNWFGLYGASIATAVSVSLQNILALRAVKRRFGYWVLF